MGKLFSTFSELEN